MDLSLLEPALAQARQTLQKDQASLLLAQASPRRSEALAESQVLPQADLDRSTRSQNTKSCSAGVKLRREDFNQVRAGLLLFPHVSADFIGRAGRLASPFERFVGCQDTRAGEYSFRNCITKRNIVWRAYTLHRREACHQSYPRIRRRLIGILLSCPFRASVFAVLAEDPCNMHVRVNPARQHRQAAQVIVHRPLDR
jgi:hypothetical protein